MEWNALPELIAALVLVILLINSRGAYYVPTLRNKMFRHSLWFTTLCLFINSITILTIIHAEKVPLLLNIILNSIFFSIYPLMSSIFVAYILLFVYEQTPERHKKRLYCGLILLNILAVVNIALTIANLKNGWLFSFDSNLNYIRGPLNRWPFFMAVFNILIGIILTLVEYKYLDPSFLRIVGWFPLLSSIILVIQQIYQGVMLSGTAMMVAILTVYLNFQERKFAEDALTKVANRTSFIHTLSLAVQKNRKFALILISLDDFKLVNEAVGRERGDKILQEIATRLTKLFPKHQVYRYSGDEFVVVCPTQDTQMVENSLSQIHELFEKPISFENRKRLINTATVLLFLPFEEAKLSDPLNVLDFAVRHAKNRGKSEHLTIDGAIYGAMNRRNQIIERLKGQLDHMLFSVEFQPIYDLEQRQFVMAEALLRAKDPFIGEIPPSELIPIAEEYGMIEEIGLWVFERCCQLLQRLNSEFKTVPTISINFSGRQFFLDFQSEKLLQICHKYGDVAHKVKLEITESTFLGSDYPDIMAKMNELEEGGIKWFLDDFGTGYANMMTLAKLPFEAIKLDRSLISESFKNPQLTTFVQALVQLISNTGAKVIAEGIETKELEEHARLLGCHLTQGYFYHYPLSEDRFVQLLS